MTEKFVALKCQSCGASLEVYDDMERFACGYCGTEMIVQRRGGTVALKAVAEAIHRVQIGTDKTAAELALARYQSECNELRARRKVLSAKQSSDMTKCFVIGGIAVFIAVTASSIWVASIGAAFIVTGIHHLNNKEIAAIDSRLNELSTCVEEKKAIAES
jgi:ribosomal protein S27E